MANHSDDFLKLAADAKSRIRQVSPVEAEQLVDQGALLLDVRERDEFERGHLDGATHMSRGILEMHIGELAASKATLIVCYCGGGNRGALAAESLQRMGYTQVVSIEGGLAACNTQKD
ncbi:MULTISPECIES: rhodanese-like domain-containing protein [Pseudomonas]|uniref:Rhodanese-related sulfurtransferase n=1 Tax=Pseudomonas lutea TaxID=243924 RepID=A0A9X8QHU0_9PSED|nr:MULTISPECIES: rhodanese-like domain-containing protein [Pseudomonas]SEP76673.1 Rhodanese-related sulfurtransferase [Pseudomonas lutea]